MPSPLSPPHDTTTQSQFEAILEFVDSGHTDRAAALFKDFAFDALPLEEALSARALALHLTVSSAHYVEALHHADAALELSEQEPLIYNLMGQALWALDHHRSGAEALVRAAEMLLQIEGADNQTPRLPFDDSLLHFMAGEACKAYEEFEAALGFFEAALQQRPGNPEILEEIAAMQQRLGASHRVA